MDHMLDIGDQVTGDHDLISDFFAGFPLDFPGPSDDFTVDTSLNIMPDQSLWAQQDPDHQCLERAKKRHRSSSNALEPGQGTTDTINSDLLISSQAHIAARFNDQLDQSRLRPPTKTEKISPELWEHMFPAISRLFASHKLDRILQILPEEYTFTPSRKQLRSKLTQWQNAGRLPTKNIKKVDMDYMVLVAHIRRERDQVETEFTYFGFPLDQQKLREHETRFGVQHRKIDLERPPQHITWTTSRATVPEDRASPESSKNPPHASDTLNQTNDAITLSTPIRLIGSMNFVSCNTIAQALPIEIESGAAGLGSQEGGTIIGEIEDVEGSGHFSIWNDESIRLWEDRPAIVLDERDFPPEAKSVYSMLIFAEQKCLTIYRTLTGLDQEDLGGFWETLTTLHSDLLCLYQRSIIAVQVHSASSVVREIISANGMIARMWFLGYRIYSRILHKYLPDSKGWLLKFLHLALEIFGSLNEQFPIYQPDWSLCLGHLNRHRLALDNDIHTRQVWAMTALQWYTISANAHPGTGALYHRMAELYRPHNFHVLYLHARSLISVEICSSSRSSIKALFQSQREIVTDTFTTTMRLYVQSHAVVFSQQHLRVCYLNEFIEMLEHHTQENPEGWEELSAEMAIVDIAALLDYGRFNPHRSLLRCALWMRHIQDSGDELQPELQDDCMNIRTPSTRDLDQGVAYELVFKIYRTMLHGTLLHKAHSLLPYIHLITAFLVSLAKAQSSVIRYFGVWPVNSRPLFDSVPFDLLVVYLNTISEKRADERLSYMENQDARLLPEDYMLRGLVWSQNYLPNNWFDKATHAIEENARLWRPSPNKDEIREDRILWLGYKLATYGYLTYDSGRFSKMSSRPVSFPDKTPGGPPQRYLMSHLISNWA